MTEPELIADDQPSPDDPARPATRPRGTAGRRFSTIAVDQIISSASNILVAVLAARVLDVTSFGLFSLVFLVYMISQGVVRALVCEPLLVRPYDAEERPGEAIGTGLVLGLVLGAVIGLSGAVVALWSSEVATGLLILAVCAPLMVVQDLGRFLAFAIHRPARAIELDLLWLGLVVVAIGFLVAFDADTLTWFVVAWAGSGAAAGLLLFWQHRNHRIRPSLVWLRQGWSFSWRYAVSFLASHGGVLVVAVVIAGMLGAAAIAGVRGALLLYGPMIQLQAVAIAAGVSEVSRLTIDNPGVRRHVKRTTAITTFAGAASLLILLALPDALGELVLGDTWSVAEPLLLPAGVQMMLLGMISGVRSTLLGVRAIQKTMRIDIATTVIIVAATVTGALLGGIVTAFWFKVGAHGAAALIWWMVYGDHVRKAEPSGVAAPAPAGS